MRWINSTKSHNRTNGNRYTKPEEFRRLFSDHEEDLSRLALLICAEKLKVPSCLSEAMKECLSGQPVASGWGEIWIRKVVARIAVRIVIKRHGGRSSVPSDTAVIGVDVSSSGEAPDDTPEYLRQILCLEDFPRIVFVLCSYEGYSVSETALLLGRLQTDVQRALRETESLRAHIPANLLRGSESRLALGNDG